MNKNTNPELIVKSLEKLAQYGDVKITNAIKEYHKGERVIRFSNMPKNQYGKTVRINDRYSHFVTERFKENTPENQVSLAVTLAHEFKRSATSDTIEAETRELILDDTKIIESFALSYGEGIYKKFPEYGILHYIKKIFGETELKDFADYAFDSSGSYWKVNDTGDLLDNGNVSQVKDVGSNVIYSGSRGRQGTLQEWLGSANAFTALMQSAGYEWSGTGKKWTKNPGKITHNVIEQAHKDGKLTDDQYNLIRCAAGLAARNKKEEKASLFAQVLRDYQKAERIRTQIQIDMVNRAWEWIKKKWDAVKARISTDKENSNVAINENEQQINSKSTEELKLSASRVSNRIPQNDLKPDKPNGPCLFRALLAAVEEKISQAFSLQEIKKIEKICSKKENNYIGNEEGEFFVNKHSSVIKTALSQKGYNNAVVVWNSQRKAIVSGNADYTIRYIKSKKHFQLGDKNGNLLWEPYKYNNPDNAYKGKADGFNEITISLGGKNE